MEETFGHSPERHIEGIHRAEGIHLSAGTFDAAVIDTFEFSVKNTPKFNPFRSAAITSARPARPPFQELAFTLRDAMEYVEWGCAAELDVDQFVPQIPRRNHCAR